MGCVNRVLLVDSITKHGVTVKYGQTGTPYANFTLMLSESGQDGKQQTIFIACEVRGKRAEAAGELEAGQFALFEGKLARRKKGESWETVVAGFEETPVLAPVAATVGSN